MSDEAVGELAGGGTRAPKFKFEAVGSSVAGVVTATALVQLPDMGTNQPQVWPDGRPRMTPILTLETSDGPRAVFCTGGVYTAVASAMRERWPGVSEPVVVGSYLEVVRLPDGKGKSGGRRHYFRAAFADAPTRRPAAPSGAETQLRKRFVEVFTARWAEVCAAKGWGDTGQGELARRALLHRLYGVQALSGVTEAQILGPRGGKWLRDLQLDALLEEVSGGR